MAGKAKQNAVPIVTIGQLEHLIELGIMAKRPIMITGAPGIGKTAAPQQVVARKGYHLLVVHPVVSDPTDAKGMPCLITDPETGEQSAVFLPFNDLETMINHPADGAPLIVHIDDLGQAPPMVQAAWMQILLARAINHHKISDNVHFIACTNRKEDRAGVKGILEPVKSRFAAIVELQPSLDEWIGYALSHKLYPTIAPFIRFRPSALHDFTPSAGMEQSPCPRTWEMLSDMLFAYDQAGIEDPILRNALIQGAVGEGVTGEFLAFERVHKDLPDLDAIIKDPDSFVCPDLSKLSVLYAIAGGVAIRCTKQNIGRILKIAAKLPQEYAASMVNDCLYVCPDIRTNEQFTDWCVENADIFL